MIIRNENASQKLFTPLQYYPIAMHLSSNDEYTLIEKVRVAYAHN